MSIPELIEAIKNEHELIWNDPDPIIGNDYTISKIEEIDYQFDCHTPIYIEYNEGGSSAQVFAHEILNKQ